MHEHVGSLLGLRRGSRRQKHLSRAAASADANAQGAATADAGHRERL